ncbi:MAG: type II toxin-antitoxin system Phd/YefM family antitoxin [Patescibacteria group bacterium]
MSTKNILSITEARKNIFKLSDAVQKSGVYYTLVQYGRPKAVLMSAEQFDSWQETMSVMRDFPDLKNDIKEAEEDLRLGRTIALEEVLAKQGYILADKAKKSYVPFGVKPKGRQRTRKNTKPTKRKNH